MRCACGLHVHILVTMARPQTRQHVTTVGFIKSFLCVIQRKERRRERERGGGKQRNVFLRDRHQTPHAVDLNNFARIKC